MDIKKYIYGHCIHPVKVKIYDAVAGREVIREVPCGKCLHCRNTHINEWVTRLFAQKKYSKYCYYVSLDYAPFDLSDSVGIQLASETAATYHNINQYGKYGMHPLILCKNHLQDFYKRLRKNTGVKLQYFACGEYGTHAKGRGYGRPHFHNIIFCDSPLDYKDFVNAWTIHDYVIGRVDLTDMSLNYSIEKDSLKIFKYVCKYLQKANFDFEQLATIDFHRTYFESMYLVAKQNDLLQKKYEFSQKFIDEKESLWREYIKQYSPFVVCSRRPSIGSQYLADNLERFKVQDFRLFGLPKDCSTFPRYYFRYAKESLCDFKSLGEQSRSPVSSSRMAYISEILTKIQNYRFDVSSYCSSSSHFGCVYKSDKTNVINIDGFPVPCHSLNFYDSKNRFLYQFDGYNYKVWAKSIGLFHLLDVMDINEVLSEVVPNFGKFYNDFLVPNYTHRVLTENELHESILADAHTSDPLTAYQKFKELVYAVYQTELNNMYKNKLLMSNSKTSF